MFYILCHIIHISYICIMCIYKPINNLNVILYIKKAIHWSIYNHNSSFNVFWNYLSLIFLSFLLYWMTKFICNFIFWTRKVFRVFQSLYIIDKKCKKKIRLRKTIKIVKKYIIFYTKLLFFKNIKLYENCIFKKFKLFNRHLNGSTCIYYI